MPQQRQHGLADAVRSDFALQNAPRAHELVTRGERPRRVARGECAAANQLAAEGKRLILAPAGVERGAQVDELELDGSLAFSVLSGGAIFLCFLFSFKKGRFWQCVTVFWAALMIGDLILLLIYKETGLIEAMPVLTGVVLLNIAIYQKEKVTAYAA